MSDREFGGECVCCSVFKSESRLLFLILVILAARIFLNPSSGGCLGSSLQMLGIDTALSSAFTLYESWYGCASTVVFRTSPPMDEVEAANMTEGVHEMPPCIYCDCIYCPAQEVHAASSVSMNEGFKWPAWADPSPTEFDLFSK